MKKIAITLVLCVVIVAGGAGITIKGKAIRSVDRGVQAEVEERLPNVKVRPLRAGRVDDLLVLTGDIHAWEEVTISAETTGKIELQDVEEGDIVTKGQDLVRINTTTIRATMAQAAAGLRLAKLELGRVEKLREGGISSPQELDRALTDREAAVANVRLAEIQLEHSVIRAQIGGVVDKLFMEEGEFVNMGTHLIHIVQVHKVKAVIGLPERDVGLFSPGDSARVALDAHPGKVFEGRIHRIATSAEEGTRTFATEIELDNADRLLRPGMIARATLVRSSYEDAITIELFAVISRGDQRVVFIEDDGVARERAIEIGFFQGNQVHITDGLGDGDRLIVLGQRELREGQRVAVQIETE